ncbi:MAG: DMT family transporter [Ktedonobacterales bacterium]|nr:DMT family transporter [Ktedonobacterales bacterium]
MTSPARQPRDLPNAVARASRARVSLVLLLGIGCVGFSPIFTRWSGVPGTVSAFYRMLITVLALGIPFSRQVRQERVERDTRLWLWAAAAGIFLALDLGIWNTSLSLTSVANATLLDNDAPIFVGLGALLLFRERLGTLYWIGLVVALAGMMVVTGQEVLGRATVGSGDLLAAGAGVFYALFLLATQRVRTRLHTLPSLWLAGVGGLIPLLAFNLATQRPMVGFSGRAYLALLALGLISQVGGWLAINYALGNLSAAVVSVTLLGQPILTALLAVPLLGEPLAPHQLVGGAVALVGIYLVNRGAA